jgi:hypothetical protein
MFRRASPPTARSSRCFVWLSTFVDEVVTTVEAPQALSARHAASASTTPKICRRPHPDPMAAHRTCAARWHLRSESTRCARCLIASPNRGLLEAVQRLGVGVSDLLLVVAAGKRFQKTGDGRGVESVERIIP